MEDSVASKTGQEFETCPFSFTRFVHPGFLHSLKIESYKALMKFILSLSVDIFKDESFEQQRNVVMRNP